MQNTTPDQRDTRSAKLAGVALVLLAAIAGWLSYASLRALAVPELGPIAGSVFPFTLDTAILASSTYYTAGARVGRPQAGYRMLTRALIGATIAINAMAAHDWRGVLVHTIAPAVFASLVELRQRQLLAGARAELGAPDRIPVRLWLVNPIESFRLSLWTARQGSFGAQRATRERQLIGLRALEIAVPNRKGDGGRAAVARSLVARQIKAGTLDPRALVEATGLDQLTPTPGAEAVLRVALVAALGARTPSAPRTSRSQSAGAGSSDLVLPAARRTRTPGNPNPGRGLSELRDAALDLHRAHLADTGRPATLRALKTGLGIGQDRASELRTWLSGQPITAVNGSSH